MKISIEIKNQKISLSLLRNNEVFDYLIISEEHNLSEELLSGINHLLQKNKLNFQDIKKIEVDSDLGDNFTTTRIAKSVANAWNWNQKAVK